MATFVTATSYGSWLHGDIRGCVEDGIILPVDPERLAQSKQLICGRDPIRFSPQQQFTLFRSLISAANEFGYAISDVTVESWHAHWIVQHGFDSVAAAVDD